MSPAGSSGVAAVPLFSPTGFPEEPITAGASFGPGEMGATPMPRRSPLADTLAMLSSYDDSGELSRMARMARGYGW
jgi:hypothetical protein